MPAADIDVLMRLRGAKQFQRDAKGCLGLSVLTANVPANLAMLARWRLYATYE